MWQEKEFQTFLVFGLRHFFNTSLKKKILNILDSITNVPLSMQTKPNLRPKQKNPLVSKKMCAQEVDLVKYL